MDMWTRRKAGVLAEAQAEERAELNAVVAEERAELEAKTDAEVLAELELKDPDEMEMGDDFAGFMKAAVPERLRNRALRKLWLTNPVLANVDNLVDYGDDFTLATSALETMQTTYQVGKGLKAHVDEMERQALAEADEPEEPVEAELPQEQTIGEMIEEDQSATPEIEIISPQEEEQFEQSPEVVVKRRMRFEFAS